VDVVPDVLQRTGQYEDLVLQFIEFAAGHDKFILGEF
jgi:hypothetical protein